MKPRTLRFLGVAAGLSLLTLGSMPAVAGLIKASPAPVSPFIENPNAMRRDPNVPFNRFWRNPDPKAWEKVKGFRHVAVNPVDTRHLGRRNDLFGKNRRNAPEHVGEMARYMHRRFASELGRNGKYKVVPKGGKGTLVWEFSLVQLNPSNVPVNVVKNGAQFFVPGAGVVGSQLGQGKIAIEGKLKNGETGETLLQFTDSAKDKFSLISFRDFSAYGHDRKAVDEWAKQINRLTANPHGKVRGSLPIGISPF